MLDLSRYNLVKILPIAQKSVFDGLEDGIIVLDGQGRIIDMNPAGERLIAASGTRPIGKPLAQISSELARLIEPLSQADKFRSEFYWGNEPDQGCFDLQISPLFDKMGVPVGRLVILHEITLRKHQEALLQQARDELESRVSEWTEELRRANEQLVFELNQRTIAEKSFEEIVELAPDAILLVNQEAEIILVNAKAEQMFATPREKLIGQNLRILLPDHTQVEHQEFIKQYLANPAIRPMGLDKILFARRGDGSQFPFEINLIPLNALEGAQVACTIRDISERKQALQSMRESEGFYRALFENANDAILLISIEGVIQQVNQVAADMLGYSTEELLGKSIKDILAIGEYPSARRNINALLKGKTLPIFERHYRKKDGTVFPVEVNLSTVNNIDGKSIIFLAIVRDKTESKKAEQEQLRLLEELRKSEEQLHALAARLEEVREIERRQLAAELHDRVGQNLTGLNLNLNIIQGLIPADDRQPIQSRLDETLKLVEDTTHLVRDVLADLQPPMLEEFGLVSALRWYSQNFFQRTGISTLISGDEFQPRLPKNVEVVLFRIVQEALNNVAKHTSATHVLIGLKSTENTYYLRVLDNGSGFDLKKKTNPEGRPHWGMLIMRERAASVGGRISVHSAPGKGTCVTVIIRRKMDAD
jgi:two-component system, NarL family, sensor histidine kinase UhpB